MCHYLMPGHNGRDLQPIRLGLKPVRPDLPLACEGCRRSMTEKGCLVRVVERRVASVPVTTERRRFRPVWLGNLRAKDTTERVA